jgi:hypothetical protein
VREGSLFAHNEAVLQVGCVHQLLLVLEEQLLRHEHLVARLGLQQLAEVQPAAADLLPVSVDQLQEPLGDPLGHFKVKHLVLPDGRRLQHVLLELGLQLLLPDGQPHRHLLVPMLPPDGRAFEAEGEFCGRQFLEGGLQRGEAELLLLVGGEDEPELVRFALGVDDGVGVDGPVGHEGLAVEHAGLDGPALGLEEAVDGEGECLVDLVLLPR